MNAVATMPPDRRTFIGGSDSGAVLNVSPWQTAYGLWREKTGDPLPVDEGREKFFRRGKRLEPIVLEMVTEETGIQFTHRNVRFTDPDFSFMQCEVDAISADGENFEVKTVHPSRKDEWGDEGTDAVPLVYTAQAMHNMMVNGRSLCRFGVLLGADDLRLYAVERDDKIIANLRDREREFWDMVLTNTAPDIVDLEDIKKLYGIDEGTSIECADSTVLNAVNEFVKLKEEGKDLDLRIDTQKLLIQKFMTTHANLTVGGKKRISWKTQSSSRIDATSLRFKQPAIAAEFEKKSETRVFRTHK